MHVVARFRTDVFRPYDPVSASDAGMTDGDNIPPYSPKIHTQEVPTGGLQLRVLRRYNLAMLPLTQGIGPRIRKFVSSIDCVDIAVIEIAHHEDVNLMIALATKSGFVSHYFKHGPGFPFWPQVAGTGVLRALEIPDPRNQCTNSFLSMASRTRYNTQITSEPKELDCATSRPSTSDRGCAFVCNPCSCKLC
jgi:hypothetical protein